MIPLVSMKDGGIYENVVYSGTGDNVYVLRD